MKIFHKDGIKTICRDDHPDVEGFEKIEVPNDYTLTKVVMVDGIETEVTKDLDEIKTELGI